MTRNRGFTLLEMVVSLTLFSMMTLATVTAMRTFGNTQATLEEVTGRLDEVRTVSHFLRNSIGSSLPVARDGDFPDAAATGQRHGTYFYGGPEVLIWVAPLLEGANRGGTYVLHLSKVENRLELRWHPYQRKISAITWSEQEPRVLLKSVEQFELSYRGSLSDDWLLEWGATLGLPATVRMRIRDRERYWPDVIVGLSGASTNAR